MKKYIFVLLISANALAMQANLARVTARLASNSNRQLLRQISTNYENIPGEEFLKRFTSSYTNVTMLGLCTAAGLSFGLGCGLINSSESNPWTIPAGMIIGIAGGAAAGLVWPVSVPVATAAVLYKAFSS
ncbi:hypothetical protein A3F66_06300 [candidate division TM6 bacterium RIFCSPHIGHO2_12_FULL_32_22]|nr:MAG: hypothetical protein A3F66_06300 [candidate division TM6 bacterium RIFCSPHIGHO2_12_FULL_32_22]